ncbi:unnamed protein product [Hapterophycus canaliculatus]
MHAAAMRRAGTCAARPLLANQRAAASRAVHSSASLRGATGKGAAWIASRDARTHRHTGVVRAGSRIGLASRASPSPRQAASRRYLSSGLPEHEVVGLPALSPTMETGTITEWLVKEGDSFAAGDIICMVETDKATVDFEAQDEAVLAKILVPAGTPDVAVGTPMMVLIEDKDDVGAFKDFTGPAAEAPAAAEEATAPAAAEEPAAAPPAAEAAAAAAPAEKSAAAPGGRVAASPLAKHLAKTEGYDLSTITGTGPGGRIIAADVKEYVPATVDASEQAEAPAAAASAAAKAAPAIGQPSPSGDYVDYPLSEQALAIAANLTESKQNVPHYYLTVDLKLEKLLKVRETLNSGLPEEEHLSLNDMLIKAAAIASEKVPDVNASWKDTFVRQYKTFDVNVMIGVGDGLVAPVVKDVGGKGLKAISSDVKALASSAQAMELEPHQVETGTFTVSNLGAYGVKNFAPIVRMPQACALAIGAAEERVIPNEDPESEEIYQLETMLSATLSCDHRVVDGAVSAQWLAAFRGLVENPLTMLL